MAFIYSTRPGWAVDVAMRDVKLKEVAEAFGQQGISGSLDGKVLAFVPGLHPDPASIQVSASDFIVKDLVAPGIVIDKIDATLAVSGGTLQLNPIRVARRDGRGSAFVGVNINDLRHIDLGAVVSNWPIDIPGAKAGVTASLDIPHMGIELPNAASSNPDLRKVQVDAPRIDLSGSTTLEGDQLGSIAAHAGIHGRQIDLRGLHMKLLGGRLDGQAYADLDRPIGATAEFTLQQLDFKKLALIFPELHEMSGEMTGSLRLAPATVPRPARAVGPGHRKPILARRLANDADQGFPHRRLYRSPICNRPTPVGALSSKTTISIQAMSTPTREPSNYGADSPLTAAAPAARRRSRCTTSI